jgi:hypothetical protein
VLGALAVVLAARDTQKLGDLARETAPVVACDGAGRTTSSGCSPRSMPAAIASTLSSTMRAGGHADRSLNSIRRRSTPRSG